MNESVEAVAAAIAERWLAIGLNPRPVDHSELPPALRPRLPADYLTFLEVAGLPEREGDTDDTLIRFWRPKEVAEAQPGLLVFADYLIESHRYALWLDGPIAGSVSILYGIASDPQPPIGRFEIFLAAVLADDAILY